MKRRKTRTMIRRRKGTKKEGREKGGREEGGKSVHTREQA